MGTTLPGVRRLYPLGQATYRAQEGVGALLMPPGSLADAFTLCRSEARLRRRVIEIRQGLLALGDHMDPEVADVARSLARIAGLADME